MTVLAQPHPRLPWLRTWVLLSKGGLHSWQTMTLLLNITQGKGITMQCSQEPQPHTMAVTTEDGPADGLQGWAGHQPEDPNVHCNRL